MKITLCVLLFALCANLLHGQDIPSPDFKYQVMFVKKDKTITNLDKTGLSRIQKDKMVPRVVRIVSGFKFYIKAEGCCAAVSVSGVPTEQFVVKVDPDTDPSDAIQLYKFEKKRDERLLLASKVTAENALNDNSATLSSIPLSFKRLREDVYLVSHAEQLEEGEYVFISSMGSTLSTSQLQKGQHEKGYCFRVEN